MERLLTLEEWADAVYGAHRPNRDTLRRWVRQSKIQPPPEKHGRTYFVSAQSRYIDPSKPLPTEHPSVRRPTSLVARIRRGA